MVIHYRLKNFILSTILLLTLCFGFAFNLTPVSAATIVVTTTVDENVNNSECSLREALWAARFDIAHYGCKAGSGADIISLPSGTYTLSKALTYIYTEITINGEDPSTTIIEASGCNPVAETCEHDYNVFTVWDTGNLTLNNLTIRHGNGANNGGGILNYISGNLTINNCIFTENKGRQGGGVINYGDDSTLTISDSTFMQNETSANTSGNGGAIYNEGELIITDSTLSSNSAYVFGGGIYNYGGTVTLTNSTLSSNAAESNGGGIYNYEGTATLTNSTLSENRGYSGGGIYNRSGATINLTNIIIANSILDGPGNDCANYGTIGTNISNLVEDGSCSAALNGDPLLGNLTDNGGPTETHALLFGSPAIDAANTIAWLSTDQRGVSRPQGAAYDIGAYESTFIYGVFVPLILK